MKTKIYFLSKILKFSIPVFFVFFLFPAISHAATLYWVGGDGDSVTGSATDWSTTNPAACNDGGGNASAVPGASDTAVFDADCDNGATISGTWSIAGVNLNSGYAGTVAQNATTTVGSTGFTQAGGTWTAGAVTLDINGNFTISGGTFTAPDALGLLSVTGSFTQTGSPTFNANSGILTMDDDSVCTSSNTTLSAPSVTFNKVVIDRNCNPGSAHPTFTIASGTTVPLGDTPTLTLKNTSSGYSMSLTNNGTITMGTGAATWNINGAFTNAGTVTANSISSWTTPYVAYPAFSIANSGTISMTGVSSFAFPGSFTNSGTATFATAANPTIEADVSLTVANTSTFPSNVALTIGDTLICTSSNSTLDASGVTFASVVIDRNCNPGNAHQTFTIASGTTVPLGDTPTLAMNNSGAYSTYLVNNGTITIGTGTFTTSSDGGITNNGTIQTKTSTYSGSLITNATNSNFIFTGDGDTVADTQTITSLAITYYNLTINSTDGTIDIFQLGSAPTINNNLTVTAGILDINGYTTSSTGTFSVANSAVLRLDGCETVTTPTLATGSTVEYSRTTDCINSFISQYPTAQSDTYVKSTTKYDGSYWAYYATDPTKSVTGSWTGNAWVSSGATNQRFHIDLGSAKTIVKVYYENAHSSGSYSEYGAKTFTMWGSNDATAFSTLTYGTDTNWTQLTIDDITFDQHVAANTADPKYILVTNTTAYRYYAFKIADTWGGGLMGLRRVELQTGAEPSNTIKNWTYQNLAIDGTGATFELPANTDVNGNLTITAGTLDATASNYNINVAGNWSNSGTFTPRSGTVTFDGTDQTITGDTTFYNLTISPSSSVDASAVSALTVGGNFSQTAGTFTAPTTLNVAGNFSRSGGTFTHNSGSVVLNGANQAISGTNTFNNFTKTVAATDTLTFASASTQTFEGTFTITGVEGGLVNIASSTPSSQWLAHFNSPQTTVTYANVTDSGCDAGSSYVTIDSTTVDGGGNDETCWNFPVPSLELVGYRWRIDNDDEVSASYAVAENVPLSSGVYVGDIRRLRVALSNTGALAASSKTYRLEYSSDTCNAWSQVPNSGDNSGPWVMTSSGNVVNSSDTTDSTGLTNPSGKSFVTGKLMTTANQTPAISLTDTQFSELEYAISPTSNVTTGLKYCFRVTRAGSAGGFTYTQVPSIYARNLVFRSRGGGGGDVEAPSATPDPDVSGGAGGGDAGSGDVEAPTATPDAPATGGAGGGAGGGDSGFLYSENFLASANIPGFNPGYLFLIVIPVLVWAGRRWGGKKKINK
ncbi:MAG: hypothetical protein WCT29_00090 [Candidatus Paceibacterota bacterium]|jgi:hypothetical protein